MDACRLLKKSPNKKKSLHPDIQLFQDYLRLEMGNDFPLVTLVEYGIGVHHAGLSEEVRALVEWLFENSVWNFWFLLPPLLKV